MDKNLQIPDATGYTFEKVWLMMQKSDERFEKRMRELDLKHEKERAERIELDKKREKERAEQDKKREKEHKKAEAETKALKKMIFGIGENLGKIAEDYFYNSLAPDRLINGVKYDHIFKNFLVEGKGQNAEYDVVLVNSHRLLIVEVKHKPHINDIKKLTSKQLPLFKTFFPIYKNYKVFGAIAGMTFEENVIKAAKEEGLFVFTQNQNSKNMKILNDNDFKPNEY